MGTNELRAGLAFFYLPTYTFIRRSCVRSTFIRRSSLSWSRVPLSLQHRIRAPFRVIGMASRRRSSSKELTIKNFQDGTDEDGKRINIFTSVLNNERAVKANVGSFEYVGETLEMGQSNARTHTSNLQDTVARHGFGKCIYTSGCTYEGQWMHDRRHGVGTFNYSCGDSYSGQWLNGSYHGEGTYKSSTGGDNYVGQWKEDKCDGKGVYTYSDTNDTYDGGMVFGLRSGMGTYKFANGNVYVGQYYEGERNGLGAFYYGETGDIEIGKYFEGKEVAEGVRWNATRDRACRTMDGAPSDMISLEEAGRIARSLGTQAPPVGPPSSTMFDSSVVGSTVKAQTQTRELSKEQEQMRSFLPDVQPSAAPSSSTSGGGLLSGLSFGTDGRIQW